MDSSKWRFGGQVSTNASFVNEADTYLADPMRLKWLSSALVLGS